MRRATKPASQEPTLDLSRMRGDLRRWGYCLVAHALSVQQLSAMRCRLVEQAAAERQAGIGLWLNASARGSNTQFVTTLLNKGRVFEGALEFDPACVQAAPLLEQLLTEALGGDFLINRSAASHTARYTLHGIHCTHTAVQAIAQCIVLPKGRRLTASALG
jgi:hypothetical protein